MCYNCGCLIPDDDMGHKDNITNRTFEHVAKEMGKTPEEAKKVVYQMLKDGKITDTHVNEMFDKASKAWGQPIDEAKKNTLDLLKDQLKA